MHEARDPQRYPTTKAGYQRAQHRLAQAKARYLTVCASNEEAAGSGDSSVWHDNFAYEENQRQMHQLATRVHELTTMVARLQVVARPSRPTMVSIGCWVELLDLEDDSRREVIIGGWDDSEPEVGRVALNSPIGRALVDAQVGESRFCPSARGPRELEIVRITAAAEEVL